MPIKFRVCAVGLIPAGAGNITWVWTQADFTWAHPRGCGEHQEGKSQRATRRGSSPRVRGTYIGHLEDLHDEGLIPAGAGNIMWKS